MFRKDKRRWQEHMTALVLANQRPPMKVTLPTIHLFDRSVGELIEQQQGKKRAAPRSAATGESK